MTQEKKKHTRPFLRSGYYGEGGMIPPEQVHRCRIV